MKYQIKIFIIAILTSFALVTQAQTIQVRAATIQVTSDTIIVPIFVDSMTNVASLSLTLGFDNSALGYISFENTASFSSGMIANVVNGNLFIAWFNLNPVSTVSDTLVKLKFVRGSGCFSDLYWDLSNPGANQITDINGTTLPTNFTNGLVSFLIEDSPDLLSPADGSQDIFVYSELNWTSAECFVNYRLQVATDTLFTNTVVDTLLQDTFYTPPNLIPGEIYHWRVAKVDTRDSLFWSPIWTYTTGGLATIRPTLPVIKVLSDTIVVPVVVDSLFDVTNFNLVLNYDNIEAELISIDNLSNLSNVNITTNTAGEILFDYSSSIGSSIVKDTLALLTFIQKGCETALTWDTTNATSNFTYLNIFNLPAIFQDGEIAFLDNSPADLISPVDQSVQVFFQPNLTWHSEECVENFNVQVALDAAFTNIIVDTLVGNDTTYQLFNLNDTTTYYWHVARIDLENNVYWSPTWEFRTEEVVLVQTKVHSASTYGDTLLIPITIDTLGDAAAFELYLDYDNTVLDFVNYFDTTTLISGLNVNDINGQVQITWSSTDSTANTAAQILSDTLLQLRFARVGGCYSDLTWNAATQFTHIVPTINLFSENIEGLASFLTLDQPTAIAPTGGSTTLMFPQLHWTSAACATEYQVQVATDSLLVNMVVDTFLNDTTFIPTVLQANTKYYWRALKIDTDGNSFTSDTLTFITGDAYTSRFGLENVSTEEDTVMIPIVVDSLFWLTHLYLKIEFDTTELTYNGFSNVLLNGMTISETDNMIDIGWTSTSSVDIVSDTLAYLKFTNRGVCASNVNWVIMNTTIVGYEINVEVPLTFENGSLNFINTQSTALHLPPDNSITLSQTPTLTWRTENCSEEYQLQVAEDTFFTNIILDQSGLLDTAYTFTNNLTAGTDYFWRVARMDVLDSLYWSETWKFRVIAVGTDEVLLEEIEAKVYPNPFNQHLIVEATTEAVDRFLNIQVFTINGQLIQEEHIEQNGHLRLNVNTGDWSSGIYILKMQTQHRTKVIKLVK